MTSKTELKDFHEHLCGDTRYVNVSSDAVRMAHLEFVREAEAAEQQAKEDAERAVTQRRARFLDMLERGLRKFTREQNWAEVATIFAREGDFNAVEDPDMREALFMEFVASNPWTSRGSRRDDDRGHRRSSYDGDRDRGRKHGRSRSRSPPRRTRRRSHSPSSGGLYSQMNSILYWLSMLVYSHWTSLQNLTWRDQVDVHRGMIETAIAIVTVERSERRRRKRRRTRLVMLCALLAL